MNPVDKIGSSPLLSSQRIFEQGEQSTDEGFGHLLGETITETSRLLQEADAKHLDVALGKTENLHEALITFEKAETSLKLLTQIRNKALEAYNEILKMPM